MGSTPTLIGNGPTVARVCCGDQGSVLRLGDTKETLFTADDVVKFS